MGKSGGILIIGVGVALLSLAYTGRAQAVYAAFTGSTGAQAPADAADGDTEPAQAEPGGTAAGTGQAGDASGVYTGYGPIGVSPYVRV